MDRHEDNNGGESPKKGYNFRKKTRQARKKNYKINSPKSDSDSDSDWEPVKKNSEDSDFDIEVYSTDDESAQEADTIDMEYEGKDAGDDGMETLELQRFIQKIFPSKSGQERLEQLEKLDKLVKKQNKKSKKSSLKSRSRRVEEKNGKAEY